MSTVPQLVGLTPQEAQGRLAEAGLGVGETSGTYTDAVPPGMIVSTHPACGVDIERGSSVTLTLSKGPEMVAIPSLLGHAEADALAALRAQGFQVELQQAYDESVGAGLVCAMEPAPDTSVARGSRIAVTVSQGSAYVTCGTCGGDGAVTAAITCPECGGTGLCDT
jgi:serine/threonine-protein kinase